MGPSNNQPVTEYDGLIVQSSLKGVTIPRGWGTFKTGCNLVDYVDFSAKQESSNAGKGGGGKGGQTYQYSATLVLGICGGPIYGIRTIWKDQAIYTAVAGGTKTVNGSTITYSSQTPAQAAGLSAIFTGTLGQAPWSYLTSAHPVHALGYSLLCYAAAENYNLNSSATSPNHNFEVQSNVRSTVNGVVIDDALASDIVADMLPRVPQWPAGAIGDLTALATYTAAAGLWLSPLADSGRQASDLLGEILTCSNSDAVWSDGVLKFVPYGDTAITANGVTFTPDLTPIYSLTWDDIIPTGAGDEPIQWDFTRGLDAYNYVQVGFLDRSQQYAADSVPAVDQANINTFGLRRQDPQSYNSICDAGVAGRVAQLLVQRSANVRRTAQFCVSELFGLLDPMDLIEIPDRKGDPVFMRIIECNEQDGGLIEIKAEEMLVGAAHAPDYTRQTAQGSPQDANVDPGDSSPPVLFTPPLQMTNGDHELWIGTSGGANWGGCQVWVSLDNVNYGLVGAIWGGARYGETTANFPSGSDPDTTDPLSVDLTVSGGALLAGSSAEADAGTTLCLVGSEIVAYSAATQTGAYTYTLGTYLRRGQYGTTIASAASGSQFVRLDDHLFKYSYGPERVGQTVYVKLAAFNSFGQAQQPLDLVAYYTIQLGAISSSLPPVKGRYLGAFPSVGDAVLAGGVAGDTYFDETLGLLQGIAAGGGASTIGGGSSSSGGSGAAQTQSGTAAAVSIPASTWTDLIVLPFAGLTAGTGWETLSASIVCSASAGNLRVVERQSGHSDVVVSAIGSWTIHNIPWSFGSISIGQGGGSDAGPHANTYTGAVSLVLQADCAAAISTSSVSFKASWAP